MAVLLVGRAGYVVKTEAVWLLTAIIAARSQSLSSTRSLPARLSRMDDHRIFDGACVFDPGSWLAQRWLLHVHGKVRNSGWRGVSLVAITYVYFLIFAQFAFLKRLTTSA